MTLKNGLLLLVFGIILATAVIYFRSKKGAPAYLGPKLSGPDSPEPESNYNPFRPFNPVMDMPGTKYTIAKTGFGKSKSQGKARVIQGQPVTKSAIECAAMLYDGQWYVGVNYNNSVVWVTPDFLERA